MKIRGKTNTLMPIKYRGNKMKVINLGIVAHVDAGKTTLTESLLHESGVIKEKGRVDKANTVTDNLSMEKERGITIKETTVSFMWKGTKINLLDTPGHADFFSEVARSLQVLDVAILVVSAKEGIQTQTIVLNDYLKRLNIPTIIFINKLDRVGANVKKVCHDIQSVLDTAYFIMQKIKSDQQIYKWNEDKKLIEDNVLSLSEYFPELLEIYQSNSCLAVSHVKQRFIECFNTRKIVPIFQGIALKSFGIKELLDSVVEIYQSSIPNDQFHKLCAIAYKIVTDESRKKKTYFRVYQGEVNLREKVSVERLENPVVIKNLEGLQQGKIMKSESISEGDIGILTNVSEIKVGDVLGYRLQCIKPIPKIEPILTSSLILINDGNRSEMISAIYELIEEDPNLDCEINAETSELTVKLFGEIQKQFLKNQMLERFGIRVEFQNTMTILKEPPLQHCRAKIPFRAKEQPFNAAIELEIIPMKETAGIEYESKVSYGYLSKSFQNAVHEGVLRGLKKGPLGWEVTNVKVIFTEAVYDSVSSTPADFRNLAPYVVKKALKSVGTYLLEPLLEFEIITPSGACGKIIQDIENMKGRVLGINNFDRNVRIIGKVPLNTSKSYPVKLASYTEGKGIFTINNIIYSKRV